MGRSRRRKRRAWWLLGLAAALAPGVASASAALGLSYLPTPEGFAMLYLPEGSEGPFPVVVLIPDALGPDPRSAAYHDVLNAQGVATVELLPAIEDGHAPWPAPPSPSAPPSAPAAAGDATSGIVAALSADPRVDASRLGVVAFGAGGQAALAHPALAGAPTALLYPGCVRLAPPPSGRPLLVLHGGVDRADQPGACARWSAAAGPLARRHEYVHATYGWDYSDSPWADGLALLPSPGEPGRRIWARADKATTADAASRVMDFLVEALDSSGAAAR